MNMILKKKIIARYVILQGWEARKISKNVSNWLGKWITAKVPVKMIFKTGNKNSSKLQLKA